MEDEAPVIYGLEFQARALTAQTAETDSIRFLVGTQSLRAENQVHHIDFDDESNVVQKNVFMHREGEIWNISSCTFNKNLLTTCYNKTSESKSEVCAAVWNLPADFDTTVTEDSVHNSLQPLQLICNLDAPPEAGDIKCILWHPTGDSHSVVGVADSQLLIWDLDMADSSAKLVNSTSLEGKGHPRLTCGKWNPHHNCTQIVSANDTTIRGWDIRTMQQVYSIENAHSQLVRDLDFNPNKQYYLVSCGDDCRVRFWDIRKPTECLKVLSDHSHWVWTVRFNHFHDQLLLTSSSDSRVILNSVVTLSSEPFGHLVDDEDNSDDEDVKERSSEPAKDVIIGTYEEHEDSVYAAEWSTADPWVFVSLSYDGRLVFNKVPRTEKYKILL